MAASDDPRLHVLSAEGTVCAAIFSTLPASGDRETRVSTGAEALLGAAAAAREGKRAAAVLAPGELLGAIDALHAVVRRRAPIVVHVVGAPPEGGKASASGRDEIAPSLDAGAGVLVSWSTQETVDLALAARRAAEDAETPFLVVTDGGGPVAEAAGLAARFLGAARDGATVTTGESKRTERGFAARVPFALSAAMRELGELTGRPLAPVERYETADAEEIVVAVGQAYTAARAAAEGLRREGRRVGAVGVRSLRPLFPAELVKVVSRARALAVVEPLDVALAPAGPVATSLKAAFADAITWAPGFPGVGHIPPIVSVVFATLAGAVTEGEVREALGELAAGDRARRLLVFGSDTSS
jgi:pyruvate-ferredoxin/flavodoxin oxidoreductase